MKNVVRRRLDKSGKTEVRTFRGATVKTLTEILKRCSCPYPNVEKISICIGTNDCAGKYPDGDKLLDNMDELINVTKQVFTSASICIIAIPPQSNPAVNKYISRINKKLTKRVAAKNATFKSCNSLWLNHVNSTDGVVDRGILNDNIHLSEYALGLLLQHVTFFFFGPPQFRKYDEFELTPDLDSSRSKFVDFHQTASTSRPAMHQDLSHDHHNSSSKKNNSDNVPSELPKVLLKLKKSCLGLWKRYTEH